jgi:hypothetical protein
VSAPEQVRIPAIGLMIGGVLSLLYVIFDLIFSVLVITGVLQGQAPANLPPFIQNLVQPNPMQLKFAAIFDCVKIVTCAVVIYGAVKMQRLESYGLAVTSSILSLIPCVTCCCCLGLPFGVWSLVVLNRPEVRASFR